MLAIHHSSINLLHASSAHPSPPLPSLSVYRTATMLVEKAWRTITAYLTAHPLVGVTLVVVAIVTWVSGRHRGIKMPSAFSSPVVC